MNRTDIAELHFIAPIRNVPSILQHGILSHRRADQLPHDSVAMQEVQNRRQDRQIPGARCLHEFANLYFDAHNPMLSKRREQNEFICVLRISTDVLNLLGVIIADRNAASDWVKFSPVADGLARIDHARVYARYWTHRDEPYEEMRHKSEKCAEVLVPDQVAPGYIRGAYVANAAALAAFQALNAALPVTINHVMFF